MTIMKALQAFLDSHANDTDQDEICGCYDCENARAAIEHQPPPNHHEYICIREDDEVNTVLHLTDEGLVVDVCDTKTGEVIASTWMLAQELTEEAV